MLLYHQFDGRWAAGADTQATVHTMEDIAGIYEKLGNIEARRLWLNRAAVSAQCSWDDTVVTAHIMDKISSLGMGTDNCGLIYKETGYKLLAINLARNTGSLSGSTSICTGQTARSERRCFRMRIRGGRAFSPGPSVSLICTAPLSP